MKSLCFLLVVFLFVSCVTSRGKRKVLGSSDFQIAMNAKFKDATTSPLVQKDLKNFTTLDFFPIQPKYKVTAVLIKTPDAPLFYFPTTTKRTAVYEKYGIITFRIDSQEFSLVIYKDTQANNAYKDNLFLPFLDASNGVSTYQGGRYVDVLVTDETPEGTIEIDFNTAYNPYCAYSDTYSCPIPPKDNYMNIEILAGVKDFKKK